jgi:hopanoid biosynthesis associated RND transporter like protein HpnN
MLKRMFDRVSEATERLVAGDNRPMRWRDELFDDDDTRTVHRAFVLIDPALAERDFQPELPGIDALRELLATLTPEHPEARFRLTGSAVMDAEELETVADDAKLTTALSFVLVAVVLAIGLRSPTLVTGVLITLACGLIWTAAFATAAVGALNIISVCFAVLFIGMGVDFGIQFTLRYLEQTDRGMARAEALVAAAEGAGGALALAAVGAAICFFVFVPTSYLGLAQLGVISGWSMVIAWFANLTVLPALLRFLPVPSRRVRQAAAAGTGQAWVQRHHRGVLFISGVLVLGSLSALPFMRFDLNPLNLKDGATDGVAAFRDLASDPESSPYPIQVLAPTLDEAAVLADRIETLPQVDMAITLESYVPSAQDEKLEIITGMNLALADALSFDESATPVAMADELAAFKAFQTSLATAQESVAPESGFGKSLARLEAALSAITAAPGAIEDTLPELRRQLVGDLGVTLRKLAQLLEAEEVSLATLPKDLRERWVAADGQARIQVMPSVDLNAPGAMRAFAEAVQSVAPSATDAPVELHEGARAVIRACISASLWALLLTILLHHLVLHGLHDALLVAAPLVVAMLLTVATAVVFSVPFNFANIIALPLLIGLNNAYGAYLVVRKGHTADVDSLLSSSTPRAILFSGLTAIASFGVLAVSKHPGMAGMGVLISVSLSYAILSALIVLPALMAALDARASLRAQP